MVAKGLLGYGYSAPFSASFERPVLCSMADLEKVTKVVSFFAVLLSPGPDLIKLFWRSITLLQKF